MLKHFISVLYPNYLKMPFHSTPIFIHSVVVPLYRGQPCASSRLALNKNRRTLNSAFSSSLGIVLSLIATLMFGCGFQPRGSQYSLDDLNSLHVNAAGANRLNSALKTLFINDNVNPQTSPEFAGYILTLDNEQFDRRVLSVSPDTGKVEEYELQYKALMNLTDNQGNILINNEAILAERNFVFNENAVLSSFSEEGVLQNELAKTVANRVLRRVQTVIRHSK